MKKIVLLKEGMPKRGGLEKYTNRLAHAFRNRGLDVTLLTSGASSIPHIQTKSFVLPDRPRYLRLETFDRLCSSFIKKQNPDIIFGLERTRHQTHIRAGNGVHAAYLDVRAFLEGRWKKFYFHASPLHRKLLAIEKESFESPHLQKLFCNSFMVKKEILEHYHTDPEKIEVIHNGVEWQEMEASFQDWPNARVRLLQKFQIPNTYQFLFIGNGYQRKGLKPLLLALSRLQEDFHLSVIGKDKNGAHFKKYAEKLGLRGKVTFFGPRDDVQKFYQLADALVIPSYYDPFANVTLEALAMGLFVVSSKHNGGYEIMKEGVIIEDLFENDSLHYALERATRHPKTLISSRRIRKGVEKYDFSEKLMEMVDSTIHG